MNEEKSPNMFFPVLFGIMGISLLILAWLIPADTSDRIIAAAIGSAGLFVAIIRIPSLRRTAKAEPSQIPTNNEVEEES
jgi:hypothetical protein